MPFLHNWISGGDGFCKVAPNPKRMGVFKDPTSPSRVRVGVAMGVCFYLKPCFRPVSVPRAASGHVLLFRGRGRGRVWLAFKGILFIVAWEGGGAALALVAVPNHWPEPPLIPITSLRPIANFACVDACLSPLRMAGVLPPLTVASIACPSPTPSHICLSFLPALI